MPKAPKQPTSSVTTQIEGRAKALRATIAGIRNNESTHRVALRDAMKATLAPIDEGKTTPIEALRRVVAAERMERLLIELEAQRNLYESPILPFATQAAREGYQLAMTRIRSLEVESARGRRWPEPLVLYEAMATPVTYVRGARVRSVGLTGDAAEVLPFPLVLVPWYPEESLGSLCLVQHEIGHNIDEDLGIAETLEKPLAQALERAKVESRHIDAWMRWCVEVVADTFGVLFGGVAFALEMAAWANALGDDNALAGASHPLPSARVAFAYQLLDELRVPIEKSLRADVRASRDPSVDQARTVARIVLNADLPALRNGSFADIAREVRTDHRRVVRGASRLAAGAAKPGDVALRAVPFRLLPSLARVAVELGADAAAVTKTLLEDSKKRDKKAATPFRDHAFAAGLRDIAPPLLDEEQPDLKTPPMDLFGLASTVSFVGATNDGLPKMFESYLAKGGARKEHIEIFFLSESAVRGLACPERSADKTMRLRRDALDALTPARMRSVAKKWTIYEHDEPYFFASFWDADRPLGRIHVSAHGWGQDIKRAPSVDHVWPAGSKSPARVYDWYLKSLEGLRARARRLAGG